MKAMLLSASLLVAVSIVPAAPPAAADPISTAQAYGDVGQCMTVEGHAAVVADSSRPGMDILLDGSDQRSAPFLGYVRDTGGLPDLSSLDGQTVDITGVVLMDRGVAEIQLTSPDYVWVAGNAPSRLIACDHD
jgi:hypothetical protein